MTAPSIAHESRVDKLRTIAGLAGYTVSHPGLADGSRPDLAACDPNATRWMIGDAKHTEDPGCVATAVRLNRYLAWVKAAEAQDIDAVFMLCCPRALTPRWLARLRILMDDANMSGWSIAASDIGDGDVIVSARRGQAQESMAGRPASSPTRSRLPTT